MSENFVWAEYENFHEEELQTYKKTDSKKKNNVFTALKILVLTLCVVLVIEALAYFIIIPSSTESKISFTGLQTLDAQSLSTSIIEYCGTKWARFDTSLAASRMLSFSAVESVSVSKKLPNRIIVDVKERIPVAFTLATVQNKTLPVLIDKNGVIFSLADGDLAASLPLITGLNLDTFFEGMRLDSKFYPLLQQVSLIRESNPEYFSVISEILITPKEFDNYELIIYPVHTQTRVLVDRNFTEESLKYMMVALDVVKSVSPSVSELDLRYGTVSYKMGLQ